MADPDHIEVLDGFDRLTVLTYRCGLLLAAAGLITTAAGVDLGRALTTVGVALSAWCLHLYDKRVRWAIHGMAWIGLALQAVEGLPAIAVAAGHGLVLAALSGLVLKEWFCFRIPLVRATPIALAVGVIAAWSAEPEVARVAYGLGALGVLAVAVAKTRMPLTHDIGDRAAYQV